ncbi:MAG: hypothetical protein M1834_001837 [Cirrosporium novae-zelandiae]|nr:MAG: hypothetical protein M1834_001837 [Cirrosporium novae-zelandiae]
MSNEGSQRSSSSFHLAAGLASGVISAVLLQPADLLKTRVQQSPTSSLRGTLRTIFSSNDPVIPQLWRGTLPSALRTGIGSALYFTTLNAFREQIAFTQLRLTPNSKNKHEPSSSTLPVLSPVSNLLAGGIARASVGFIMMPITVIKVRYESSLYKYTSLASSVQHILCTEGFRGFFSGFGATAIRDAPYAGLYVLFYEQGKRELSKVSARFSKTAAVDSLPSVIPHQPTLTASRSAQINFAASSIAAALATTVTNPFDTLKTRLQLEPSKYKNMVNAAKVMLRNEGIRSLFDGLALRIARKALSSALAWTLYEELIRRAENRWGRHGAMI